MVYANETIDSCHRINNGESSSMPYLKLYSKLEVSNARQLTIDFDTPHQSSLKFLLAFQIVNSQSEEKESDACDNADEFRCVNTLETNATTTLRQYTCVKKDFVCNCLSLYPLENEQKILDSEGSDYKYANSAHFAENCDYLLSAPNNFLHSMKVAPDQICDFYRELNSKCKEDRILALLRSSQANTEHGDSDGDKEDSSEYFEDYQNIQKGFCLFLFDILVLKNALKKSGEKTS